MTYHGVNMQVLAQELGQKAPETERDAQDLLAAGAIKAVTEQWRSQAGLNPQLRGLEGIRVEVEDCDGLRRFIVGKSQGWCPAHLELKRSDSKTGDPIHPLCYFTRVVLLERVHYRYGKVRR